MVDIKYKPQKDRLTFDLGSEHYPEKGEDLETFTLVENYEWTINKASGQPVKLVISGVGAELLGLLDQLFLAQVAHARPEFMLQALQGLHASMDQSIEQVQKRIILPGECCDQC